MARFTRDVKVVNHISGRVHEWEMCEPMTYRLVDLDDAEFVTVTPTFTTDFASVPRPFWFFIAPWGRHGRAAIVHDFVYQGGAVTNLLKPVDKRMRRPSKRESDRIFRQAMAVLDEKILKQSKLWSGRLKPLVGLRLALAAPRRWLMWAAVAIFGHWAYKKEQAKATAPLLEHKMLTDVAERVAAGKVDEPA
jgi:Protein of unknown function (DUF1353)